MHLPLSRVIVAFGTTHQRDFDLLIRVFQKQRKMLISLDTTHWPAFAYHRIKTTKQALRALLMLSFRFSPRRKLISAIFVKRVFQQPHLLSASSGVTQLNISGILPSKVPENCSCRDRTSHKLGSMRPKPERGTTCPNQIARAVMRPN